MATKKGFDYNTNTTPAPWGAREQALFENLIDTICSDTLQNAKDTLGHKHNKIYSDIAGASYVVVNADESITIRTSGVDVVTIGTDGSVVCHLPNTSITQKAIQIALDGYGGTGDIIAYLKANNSLSLSEGGLIVHGESKPDCTSAAPGILLDGLLNQSDPLDNVPAVQVKGSKSTGTLGALETVFQVANDSTGLLTVMGDGQVKNTNDLIDYSSSSTIVGFDGALLVKKIYYKRVIGNLFFCSFHLFGTSNATTLSFTLPKYPLYIDGSEPYLGTCSNASAAATPAEAIGTIKHTGSGVFNISYAGISLVSWANSGNKWATGQFFFEAVA